jgi:hypothetical protein
MVGRNTYRAKSAKEALTLVRLLTKLGDQEITCTNVGHGEHWVEWTRTPESELTAKEYGHGKA